MKNILQFARENEIFSVLTQPSFLYFSLSVFLSQIAFNMLSITLIFLIFHLTTSNFAVAILLFAILIPQVSLSFIGGVVADSNNKKTILVLGNVLRALVLLVMFFTWESTLSVYILTLVISIITQFYVPAEAPLIPKLVEKDKLVAANSIFGISLFGSILVGYVLAGPAVSIFGRSNVFLLITALFVAAAIFASLIPRKNTDRIAPDFPDVKKTLREELRGSINLLAKTKDVIDAFLLLIFSQIIIFILATLIPGYARNILHVPAENLSVIIFAPASIGMVISAFLIGSVFHKTSKYKLTTIGVYISGLVLFLLPFMSKIETSSSYSLVLYFVLFLALLAGLANALIFIPSQAIIQEVVPENFRSKIYGLLFGFIGVFSLIPIMAAGGVADLVGVGAVFFVLGILIMLLGFTRQKILHIAFTKINK